MRAVTILALIAAAAGVTVAQQAADVWQAHLSDDQSHPCLMFSAQDIPLIKEKLNRKPYSAWWAGVQASDSVVCRAFTWLITADAEKAEAVREHLMQANPTGYHCSCGVADPLQGCAEAYDLIYDYEGLSEQDHQIIRAKLANACERLYLSALESSSGQHPGNQRTRGLCALGTAALVLGGYDQAAHTPAQWLQRALDGIHQEANLQFWRDDGMFIEGPGYSSFTLSIMLPFARYFEQVTGKWLFDDPRLRNALLYMVYITQPDGLCAAMGTTNSQNVVNGLRLCVGAGDPGVQSLCRWAIAQWGHLGAGGVRDIGLFDDTVPPSTAGFPTTRFLPVSQEAHFRSAWSRDAVALWFKGKDPWLARTHRVYSHGDVGSFVLHAYGELLAVDAGYDHWVSYDLYPPQLHNTLLVDGDGPVNETPGLLENPVDCEFMQAGDIVAEYCSVRHRRTLALIDGAYVVIADTVEADETHDYAWQIHTPVTRSLGSVSIRGNRASWTGFHPRGETPGKVTLNAVWAEPVELATMEKSRWQPFSSSPTTGSYDNWAIIAKQGAQDTRYLTVLCPVAPGMSQWQIETPTVDGARCITVTRGDATDTILALEADQATIGSITTTAKTCIVRERDGQVEWVYLSAPGAVSYGGKPVARVTRATGGCLVFAPSAEGEGAPVLHVSGPQGMQIALPGLSATRACLLTGPGEPGNPVQVATGPQGVLIGLPCDAANGARVLFTAPDAPATSDRQPSRLAAVTIDGQEHAPAEIIDMGRTTSPPATVRLRFEDTQTGLGEGRVYAALDGVVIDPPAALDAQGVVRVSPPGDLALTDHELVVRVSDSAAFANSAQCLIKFSMRPLLVNGGFEEGGATPASWGLGAWSRDDQTKYESRGVRDNPHSGNWCLMMRGIAGGLNMVASQRVPFEVGVTYRVRGFYRGDVAASLSFCSQSGKNQYIWSPALGPSEEWTPFEWQFTVTNPEETLIFAMRLGSVGTVYFDDLSVQAIPPAPQ